MHSIKHTIDPACADVPLEDLIRARVARFSQIPADWDTFADSQVEGRRRGQHRLIGAGGSGKHDPHAPWVRERRRRRCRQTDFHRIRKARGGRLCRRRDPFRGTGAARVAPAGRLIAEGRDQRRRRVRPTLA